jgi:O-antigen ligase
MLTSGGVACLFLIAVNYKNFNLTAYRKPIILGVLFLVSSLISVFTSGLPLAAQMYGVHGRNTGFIAYASLILLFLGIVVSVQNKSVEKIIQVFYFIGLVSAIYGFLQVFDLDPLPWDQAGDWITAFYSNPNFYSAFTGIYAGIIFGLIVQSKKLNSFFFTNCFLLCANVFLLVKISSYQGFAVFLVAIATIIFFQLWTNSRYRKISYIFIFVTLVASVWALLDVLRLLPGESVIYKPSVSSRGYYWSAGISMVRDNPILGIGFDGYRDYYDRYRSYNSTFDVDALGYTDASHSIPIDIAVNGGLVLFLIYLCIQFLTFYSGITLIMRSSSQTPGLIIIFASWLGYIAQSVISINHLSLGLWGWIFSGAIIGMRIYQGLSTDDISKKTNGYKVSKNRNSKSGLMLMTGLTGGLIGFVISLPLFQANAKMWTGIEQSNPNIVLEAARDFPQDVVRMSISAQMIFRAGLVNEAKNLLDEAIKIDPESVLPWKLIYDISVAPPDIQAQVVKEIEFLDPYYFEIIERRKVVE